MRIAPCPLSNLLLALPGGSIHALKYTQEMEKAGFSREQAEVGVRLLIDVMNENFATKSDLKETEFKLGTMMTLAIGATATLIKLL